MLNFSTKRKFSMFTRSNNFLRQSKTARSYLMGFLVIFIIGFVFGYFVITIVNYYGPESSAGSSKSFWQAFLPI